MLLDLGGLWACKDMNCWKPDPYHTAFIRTFGYALSVP